MIKLSSLVFVGLTPMTNAQTCLDNESARGGILGQANFIGEPWDGSRYGVDLVPGTGMLTVFEDDSRFLYGSEDTQGGLMADNLSSLKYHWADYPPPYDVVRRTDGSIFVVTDMNDCNGWLMVTPTIVPSDWEGHPLARCLTGAYRATANFTIEDGEVIANFGNETVRLNYGYRPKPDAVIYEDFNGFRAVRENGPSCSAVGLTELEAP